MQVYYLSADKKERINFDGRTYGIADMDIFGHKWSYEERNEKIEKFKRGLLEKEIEINISDDANASWQDHYAYMQDVFDEDIINNKRGKLYVNGYYLECNVYAGETEDQFRNWCDFQTCVFKIISDRPVWIKENIHQFRPQIVIPGEPEENIPDISGEITQGKPTENNSVVRDFPFDFLKPSNLKITYPLFDFPFDLVGAYGRRTLKNESFAGANFVMTIYGFVDNPNIQIAGHPYTVYTTVYEGERLIINSAAGTVKKIGRLGEETNLYNARRKDYSVFQKIQPGIQTVSWPGTYGMDIVLFDERSEPKWSL